MIEVNLLKQDALNVVAQELGEDLSSFVSDSVFTNKKNRRLLIVGGVTAAAWLIIIFMFGGDVIRWAMRGDEHIALPVPQQLDIETLPEQQGMRDVVRPVPQISINEENVVEEIVMGVRQNIQRKKKKKIPKLLDFEKIHNQKLMVYSTLQKIGNAASLKVTFGKMVIKVPNYYYLHGLASDKSNYSRFKNTLKRQSVKIIESPVKQVGLVGTTREFTLYGSMKTQHIKERKVELIDKNEIRNYNRELVGIAENLNVQVKSLKPKQPRRMHGYKSYTFRLDVQGGYSNLTQFVKKLHTTEFPLGILQLSVVPTKDQKMFSSFDIVYFAKN